LKITNISRTAIKGRWTTRKTKHALVEATEVNDQDYDSQSNQDQSDDTEYSTNARYSELPLTFEWSEENGNDDSHVRSSDPETERNALGQDKTDQYELSPSSSTTTRIANDENADIESLETSGSEDPTYQHSPPVSQNKIALTDFYRATKVSQAHPTTASTPTTTNTSDRRLREGKLAKGRQRLQDSLIKVQEAADAKLNSENQVARRITAPSLSPPNGIQPGQLLLKGNLSTQTPWNTVGSSKRKAKDTPAKKHQAHIRKTNQIRMSKKQIISARDAASAGVAGQNN
jgi:hypothetical protein